MRSLVPCWVYGSSFVLMLLPRLSRCLWSVRASPVFVLFILLTLWTFVFRAVLPLVGDIDTVIPGTTDRINSRTPAQRNATLVLKLPTPIIVVGYPKSGTTSVWDFFSCSGLRTQHYCCCGDTHDHPPCSSNSMAHCILKNIAARKENVLEGCGDYDVYAQIDGERPTFDRGDKIRGLLLENGTIDEWDQRTVEGRNELFKHFLPQHFHLPILHRSAPNATYILPLRDPIVWANSVFDWFHMRGRVVNEYRLFNSSLERPGKNGARAFLARIYIEHTDSIKRFVQLHPSHALVEFNITDPNAGQILADAFGLGEGCWRHRNKVGERANRLKSRSISNWL